MNFSKILSLLVSWCYGFQSKVLLGAVLFVFNHFGSVGHYEAFQDEPCFKDSGQVLFCCETKRASSFCSF